MHVACLSGLRRCDYVQSSDFLFLCCLTVIGRTYVLCMYIKRTFFVVVRSIRFDVYFEFLFHTCLRSLSCPTDSSTIFPWIWCCIRICFVVVTSDVNVSNVVLFVCLTTQSMRNMCLSIFRFMCSFALFLSFFFVVIFVFGTCCAYRFWACFLRGYFIDICSCFCYSFSIYIYVRFLSLFLLLYNRSVLMAHKTFLGK